VNSRIKKCLALLEKADCPALLVSNPLNTVYLTGFSDISGCLLVSLAAKPVFFTNFLYQKAAARIKNCRVVVAEGSQDLLSLIARTVKALKIKRLGFEPDNFTYGQYQVLKAKVDGCGLKLAAVKGFVEKLRMIKEPRELKLIKKSVEITRLALTYAGQIHSQIATEKDLVIEIERFLRLKGDSEIAFNTIVASGGNTVFPHHFSNHTQISNKFFLIDLGSKYYGYCADLTRVFFWGKMPILFKRIYDTVRKSQAAAIKKIKDGARACDVDLAARRIIEKQGWGKYFGHGLGHGIGLAVHEEPRLNSKNTAVLKEGMVVTVEPAVYFKNQFGIRIEDMVLVKKNHSEVLSGDIHR